MNNKNKQYVVIVCSFLVLFIVCAVALLITKNAGRNNLNNTNNTSIPTNNTVFVPAVAQKVENNLVYLELNDIFENYYSYMNESEINYINNVSTTGMVITKDSIYDYSNFFVTDVYENTYEDKTVYFVKGTEISSYLGNADISELGEFDSVESYLSKSYYSDIIYTVVVKDGYFMIISRTNGNPYEVALNYVDNNTQVVNNQINKFKVDRYTEQQLAAKYYAYFYKLYENYPLLAYNKLTDATRNKYSLFAFQTMLSGKPLGYSASDNLYSIIVKEEVTVEIIVNNGFNLTISIV